MSSSVPRQSKQGKDQQTGQKGVVAMLQEFVQCSRHFVAQQHRPILQWTYDQRMANGTSLEFRATAAFVLDGVPHHVAGSWQPSKKVAQRDVAQRALTFFIGKWGEQLLAEETGKVKVPAAPEGGCDMRVLDDFCASYDACGGSRPKWSHSFDGGAYTGEVEVLLLEVPHKFAGTPQRSRTDAYADVARRVLWYFQCPGYQHIFAPDPQSPAAVGKDIPPPPMNWACSKEEVEELRRAERKTVLMRVQNRLQQELSKRLKPGEGVWEWTYEMNDEDSSVWPPLYRARVAVPVLGKAFVGDWARGQREAQIETSYLVAEFLDRSIGDTLAPSTCGESVADTDDSAERVGRWADLEVECA